MFATGMREVCSWLNAILSTGTVLGMPASTMRSGGLKLGNIMCWILCMSILASVMCFMSSKDFLDDGGSYLASARLSWPVCLAVIGGSKPSRNTTFPSSIWRGNGATKVPFGLLFAYSKVFTVAPIASSSGFASISLSYRSIALATSCAATMSSPGGHSGISSRI